jgi:hypothetical protein
MPNKHIRSQAVTPHGGVERGVDEEAWRARNVRSCEVRKEG